MKNFTFKYSINMQIDSTPLAKDTSWLIKKEKITAPPPRGVRVCVFLENVRIYIKPHEYIYVKRKSRHCLLNNKTSCFVFLSILNWRQNRRGFFINKWADERFSSAHNWYYSLNNKWGDFCVSSREMRSSIGNNTALSPQGLSLKLSLKSAAWGEMFTQPT